MKHIPSFFGSVLFAACLACCRTASAQQSFAGKVAETMNAGGYTYVLVDAGTNKLWAAAPQFLVKQGDLVTVPSSEPMSDFHSKTLNRDFPVIYFAGSIAVNGTNSDAVNLPAGHPTIGAVAAGDLPAGHPSIASTPAPPKVDFTGLKPAKGGKTVAEIYPSSAKLAGKAVTVRGKVVKYNGDIMGKNWLHIQDGTGGVVDNDLLVTTSSVAALGDTVLVEGKVAINQDFGSGYKYDVLIEEAKVTVESSAAGK